MAPPLGVVVLTHGDGTHTLPLLRSLVEGHGVDPDAIAVVQNPISPQDPRVPLPHDEITLLRTARNLGYAGGMNVGLRHQLERGAERLLMLTGEVVLRQGAIEKLLAAAQAAPAFGVLGPAVWWRSAGRPYSFGGVRGPRGAIDQLRDRAPSAGEAGIAPCDWVEGAAVLVRAEVLRRVGLLDERFFLYFEETEFALRVERAGWRLGVVVDAVVEQEPGLDRRPGAYAYLHTRNGLEYARRADGWRGVRAVAATRARASWQAARVVLSPRSSASSRRANWIRLVATGWGALDFLRGRWGAPPRRLPGAGELAA